MCLNIKNEKIKNILLLLFLVSCSSVGQFGAGVDITFDPRTIGMQIDDTIMQKNLKTRLALSNKKYFLSIQSEVLDGRIFLSGKVDEPEEKIKITKWLGKLKMHSVKTLSLLRDEVLLKALQNVLITSQLRSTLIFNKKTKSRNYTLKQ